MRRPPFSSPLILAPIAGPGTAALTAAVCQAGAFGILASPYSTPEQMLKDAAFIRERTDQPFGINLFADGEYPQIDDAEFTRAHAQLEPYYRELGLPLAQPPTIPRSRFRQQIDALIEIRPAVFSFTFGIPDEATLKRVSDAGIYTMGTATTVEEARALERAGVDAVCAQGSEAGGHRGSFLRDPYDSLVGTMALVPLVVDAVKIPVIAAGGIADGRGIAAALALGAIAAQCGTAFLRAKEAGTSTPYRRALENASETDTMLTSAFSGKPARGIKNRFSIEMDDASRRAPYPHQNALTRDLRARSAQADTAEYLSLWAGQAFKLGRTAPAAEIVARMLDEARTAIEDAKRKL